MPVQYFLSGGIGGYSPVGKERGDPGAGAIADDAFVYGLRASVKI